MINICKIPCRLMTQLQKLEFLAPLAIRIYLVPIFWVAGVNKLNNISSRGISSIRGKIYGLEAQIGYQTVKSHTCYSSSSTKYVPIGITCL